MSETKSEEKDESLSVDEVSEKVENLTKEIIKFTANAAVFLERANKAKEERNQWVKIALNLIEAVRQGKKGTEEIEKIIKRMPDIGSYGIDKEFLYGSGDGKK